MAMEESESDVFCFILPADDKEGESIDLSSSTDSEKRSDKSSDSDKRSELSVVMEDEQFMEEDEERSEERSDRERTLPLGTKRKPEFEDVDPDYYDSSDDSDYYDEAETTDEDGDGQADDNEQKYVEEADDEHKYVEEVELLNNYGEPISDDELMRWMENDERSPEEKKRILPQVRRYFKCVNESEGFDCTDFPGVIWGLTMWIPRDLAIHERDKYPEGYNHLFYMASIAIKDYNKKLGTRFEVLDIERASSCTSMGYAYNITFTAFCEVRKTFEACIWDNVVERKLSLEFCRVKKGSPSLPVEKNSSDAGEESCDDSSDLLELVSQLKSCSDTKLMELMGSTKKDKDVLLKKLHVYFDTIIESEGFKCSYFPSHIPGLTYLKSRQKIIENRRCMECRNHVYFMAKLAADYYFKDETGDMYQVCSVESVNVWKQSSCSYIYYICFMVKEVQHRFEVLKGTFQAKVQDKRHSINVIFCKVSD